MKVLDRDFGNTYSATCYLKTGFGELILIPFRTFANRTREFLMLKEKGQINLVA